MSAYPAYTLRSIYTAFGGYKQHNYRQYLSILLLMLESEKMNLHMSCFNMYDVYTCF